MIPCFIHWSPDVVAFSVFGFHVRWYALCWCLALYLAYFNMHRLYRHQKISDEIFEPIFIYCFLGVLIGARLGHCLFYEPAFYLSHPIEMLLPIHKFQSGWRLVGYEGLSSHGGVLGLFVAIWLYCKHTKMNVMHVLDNMGVITPLSAAFIRLGIYFCPQWRGLCPPSGAALRKSDLPAYLHHLPVCLSQAGPPCGEWLLLWTVSDEHFHLPLLH